MSGFGKYARRAHPWLTYRIDRRDVRGRRDALKATVAAWAIRISAPLYLAAELATVNLRVYVQKPTSRNNAGGELWTKSRFNLRVYVTLYHD